MRPEEAGVGATPVYMAKQATDRNRLMFAVSPAILAAPVTDPALAATVETQTADRHPHSDLRLGRATK
jgi:hypothetical protein